MGSPEQSAEGSANDNAELGQSARIEGFRNELAAKVKSALNANDENARFNEHDAKSYLNWIQSETDVSRLKQAKDNFGKTIDYVKK